ncbi:MAG: glucose-1-phosphate adenylyltransferase [Candidatus Omnitrophica bacterium]|nr:glucose-1-phosphate adenylyltransferase [Candidatus Omnitrophota bacterium]MCF7894661.1 glucose-1-phosphate adenylyltransferase [Candidatus Omnitrophota bacterium]
MKIPKREKKGILAFVLAGGRGERLHPLTAERSKPSVPFGGKYRIIDFTLSNLLNSGIFSIYILVQYKSQSLIEHVRTSWLKAGFLPEHFVTVVPPQMRRKERQDWYKGTVDSIYQNINLIYDFKPKFIVVVGGDHIFRMDIKKMIDFHINKKSNVTISAIPVKANEASQLGVLDTDSSFRVKGFIEKPKFSGKNKILASMGNYIFDTDFFLQVIEKQTQKGVIEDFGKDMMPYLVKKKARVFAYDFSQNQVPMLKSHEANYYWRDVGTINSYWQANMELLGGKPMLDLNNPAWPIYASHFNAAPASIFNSKFENSLICEGSKVSGAKIMNSIIGRSVYIEKGCKIEDSIIMDFSVIGGSSYIKKTIIDRFNFIPKATKIDYSANEDNHRYIVDSSGIVVVPRGSHQL